MADLTGMMQAAAGAAGGENLYVEDVFSTYLYTGNGSTQTITNGIDLDGEGGLVWIKNRNTSSYQHLLIDTERGADKVIFSSLTNAQSTFASLLTSFNSDGFSLGNQAGIGSNGSGEIQASWTFRKAEKFFDVVTYTGNGANRTISHNLGSVPGCIIVKRTDNTGDWQVYHRANTAAPETDYLVLNSTAATADSNTRWNDTLPTDSVFSLGTEATVNANGGTYVAYLFAHDAGGFGDDGLQNVITCGSFTSDASGGFSVNLGWEPQWIMHKVSTGAANQDWKITDVLRGMTASASGTEILRANTSGAASTGQSIPQITATGFFNTSGGTTNSAEHIYIAIRRGPMKTPTAGTEVFNPVVYTGTNVDNRLVNTSLLTDMVMIKERNDTVAGMVTGDRLRGDPYLLTGTSAAENADADTYMTPTSGVGNAFAAMNGVGVGNDATSKVNIDTTANNHVAWAFRRAPGFFDVVCYTGTGSARTVNHNLGVPAELIIVKGRAGGGSGNNWAVSDPSTGNGFVNYLALNSTQATNASSGLWNDTAPTSTVFSLGDSGGVNQSSTTYVAYLFASLPGVSKIGTYTGNGSSVTVTTGFQPRFILVKRTDSTGNWIVGDSARGLVAGDDPYLLLNSSAAEVTDQDWVDITSTSFTVNETAANANVNTGTYIYLCIA